MLIELHQPARLPDGTICLEFGLLDSPYAKPGATIPVVKLTVKLPRGSVVQWDAGSGRWKHRNGQWWSQRRVAAVLGETEDECLEIDCYLDGVRDVMESIWWRWTSELRDLREEREKIQKTVDEQVRGLMFYLRENELPKQIKRYQRRIKRLVTEKNALRSALRRQEQIGVRDDYPEVPTRRWSIPEALVRKSFKHSGIYFLWKDEVVEYVGQSVNVSNRLRGHTKTTRDDRVSMLPFPKEELNFAEAYYIGSLRPCRNVGCVLC